MQAKLDAKDYKILYELDANSRQTYRQIAKKVGLSKDSVIYKINAMRQLGIIKQFHTVIDVGKLNYISFRLYLKLQNCTPEKEEDIIRFFKSQKSVSWLVSIDGEYDIGMWILVKSIKEMNILWKDFAKKYQNQVENKWLTIFTKVSYFPRAYLLEKKSNFDEYVFVTEPADEQIEKKELELLENLASNARISVLELARKLGITPKTAASWIKSLEKRKIIIGYRTEFDLEKLGYQYFKVHFNLHNITPEKEMKLRQFIKQQPNIIFDNQVLGGNDIEIEVQVKSLLELKNVINEMKESFSGIIKDYNHMWFYKEHKFIFMPV